MTFKDYKFRTSNLFCDGSDDCLFGEDENQELCYEKADSVQEQNRHPKNRNYDDLYISSYSDRFSMECNNCMMVAMGEKASYMGMPCDSCGKVPRTPYGY